MDVDQDGRRDVVATGVNDRQLAWFDNDGGTSLSFAAPQAIDVLPFGVADVAVADFDGQNGPDVVAVARPFFTTSEGAVYLFLNDGSGGFTRSVIDNDLPGVDDVEAADLDDDGDADLVASALSGSTVRYYVNGGTATGSFSSGTEVSSGGFFSFVFYGSDVVVTDLTGDSFPEIAVVRTGESDVVYFPNQSGSSVSFGSSEPVVRSSTTPYDNPVAAAAYDVDQSGSTDLVIGFENARAISWLSNRGGSPLTFRGPYDLATDVVVSGSDNLLVTDLDGRERKELLAGTPETVVFYRSQGGDAFAPEQVVTTAVSDVSGVGVADFTGDGFPEILSASRQDDKVAWYNNQDGTLPVELAGFRGEVAGQGAVRLTWRTVSETGNAGFDVQRRPAGSASWTTVGHREGAGTTAQPRTYRFVDDDLPFAAESIAYRLRQVDTDGAASFSKTVTVHRSAAGLRLLPPGPNPARTEVTVRLSIPRTLSSPDATLRLYDVLGRQVRSIGLRERAGRIEQRLDVRDLSSGVYLLRLRAGGEVRTRRVTVVQ